MNIYRATADEMTYEIRDTVDFKGTFSLPIADWKWKPRKYARTGKDYEYMSSLNPIGISTA